MSVPSVRAAASAPVRSIASSATLSKFSYASSRVTALLKGRPGPACVEQAFRAISATAGAGSFVDYAEFRAVCESGVRGCDAELDKLVVSQNRTFMGNRVWAAKYRGADDTVTLTIKVRD